VPLFQRNRARARAAVIWSRVLPDNPEIFAAYPYPEGFSNRVEALKHLHLLKLRDIAEPVARTILSIPQPIGIEAGYLDIGRLEDGNKLHVAGWARNPEENRPADYVVLGWEEADNSFHPFTAIIPDGKREDVARVFKSPSILNAGFGQEISVSKLPRGPLTLRAWSIDMKRQRAFPMGGSVRVEVPVLQQP
jgi:hypothetical protein